MDKVVSTPADAVAGITDGATLAVGGFGLCGIPSVLIAALHDAGRHATSRSSRTTAASTTGASGVLLRRQPDPPDGLLLRRGEQGVRPAVPRRRARGRADPAGHPGRAAAGRRLRHPGVLHRRPASAPRSPTAGCPGGTTRDGNVALASPAKEVRVFERDGEEREYVLEHAIVADFGLVRAWKGDRHGNLVFNKSSRNFNPLAAMAGRVTDRRGRGARRARRARPRRRAPARHLRAAGAAAHPGAGRRQADREAAPSPPPPTRRRSPEPCP